MPNTIALSIALAFVIYSVPEALAKVGLIADEWKVNGGWAATLLFVKLIVGCLKCTTFWTSWPVTGSFITAGCMSFAAYILNKITR